jgi:signal transduction histidine kinase
MQRPLEPGSRAGRWQVHEPIGQGAFGTTWRATDDQGEVAALKVLQQMPGNELRVLSSICHPTVVAVLDGGGEPVPFVVMEYAPGSTLTAVLRAGPLHQDVALALGGALCDGLAALHHQNVAHGDLKPDNLIVSSLDPPLLKLVDFGLAGVTTGGTLAWAAPERLRRNPSSPASDVYAAGLILWTMLYGKAPWGELPPKEMIERRLVEIPTPPSGPAWVVEMLGEMLQIDPSLRSTATSVADTLAAHGVVLPAPDATLLRRRARTVHVARHEVETETGAWLERGGTLALVGRSGSGRSHTLNRVVTELQARGRPWIRLSSGTLPWAAVEQALLDPMLSGPVVPLPTLADAEDRAVAAAKALKARCSSALAVLVDDVGELDTGSTRVLEIMAAGEDCPILVAGSEPPAWVKRSCVLEPFDRSQLEDLVSGILGAGGVPESTVERIVEVSNGVPGPAVGFLLQAVRLGALVQRAHRWLAEGSSLAELALDGTAEIALDRPLSEQARSVGALLAIHELPMQIPALAQLAGLRDGEVEEALSELVAAGLVAVEARVARCLGRAAQRHLADVDEAPAFHKKLVQHLLGMPEIPNARLGWHVVGACDVTLAARLGPAAIAAAKVLDPVVAGRLADALYSLAPLPALEVPRIEALLGAGHVEEARAFASSLLGERERRRSDVPVLVALARIHQDYRNDTQEAFRVIAEAESLLSGEAAPPSLMLCKATAALTVGRLDEAVAAAGKVAETPVPSEPSDLDDWLAARRLQAQALQRRGDKLRALAVLEEVPAGLGQGRPVRAMLDATKGLLLASNGRIHDAALAYALASKAEAGLPALHRARVLNNSAALKWQSFDRAGAVADWEQALLLFERLAVPVEQVRVQVNLCLGYAEMGRWERSRQAGEWAVKQSRAVNDPVLEAMALGNLGDLCMVRHSHKEAEACFRRVEKLSQKNDLGNEILELACRRAELAVRTGAADAGKLARDAEQVATKAGDRVLASRAAGFLAVTLAREGKAAKARALIEKTGRTLLETGATADLASFHLWAAEALVSLGQVEEAIDIASRVASYAEEVRHPQLRLRAEELRTRTRGTQDGKHDEMKVARVLELAVAVARVHDLPTLLERIADAAMEFLHAQRAFVLRTDLGGPVLVTSRVAAGTVTGGPSRTIVNQALSEGREVIRTNMLEDGRDPGGSVAAMDLRMAVCMPLRDGDQVIGAIYADSRQVGDRETGESVQLMRALAAFASVALSNARHLQEAGSHADRARRVAHDMKSPTATIATVARQILSSEALSPLVEKGLRDIASEAERASRMVLDLLEDRPNQARAIDLSELVRSTVDLFTWEARSRGIRVEAEVASGLWVLGDSNALHRCFANLLSNALRHGPEGSTVYVSLEETGERALLRVTDEGPGIPPNLQGSIFDEGVRGSNEGQGLGLAIVRDFVKAHGGTVRAGNALSGGAVFSLDLPLSTRPRSPDGQQGPDIARILV